MLCLPAFLHLPSYCTCCQLDILNFTVYFTLYSALLYFTLLYWMLLLQPLVAFLFFPLEQLEIRGLGSWFCIGEGGELQR